MFENQKKRRKYENKSNFYMNFHLKRSFRNGIHSLEFAVKAR